jgi:hypothetical protein
MGSEKNELGFRNERGLALTNLMHGIGIGASLAKDIFLTYQMIVGTRFNGGADIILSELNPGEKVSLVREPDNPYDKRAIMVIDEDERKIGYIPRNQNSILSSLMDAGKYVYGIVAEPRERDLPPSQGGAVWIKLYMREYAMPDDLSVIPRQGARGSFAVVRLWPDADDDGKESLCGISAIKVINGEEKGIFHCALHEVGEDDDMLAIVSDSKALVGQFYDFAGFLPLVSHEWNPRALDELKGQYGVLLGKPFSNFLVDTEEMAVQHYRYLNDTDIDSVLEQVKIRSSKYAGDLPSCRKILALYREMEEVDKRREKEKITYATAKKQITPGTYKDKHGKCYEALGVSKLAGGEDPIVVYKKLDDKGSEIMTCTPEYFTEDVSGGRGSRKRYEKVLD